MDERLKNIEDILKELEYQIKLLDAEVTANHNAIKELQETVKLLCQ